MAGFSLGGDEKSEARRTFGRTVFEGVLDDGLKDKARDKNLSRGCGGGDSGL